MKRVFLFLIALVLLFTICCTIKLFLIGEPVDGTQLFFSITEDRQILTLHVSAMESAAALRGWKLEQNGSTLYISCRKVLVSPFFSSGFYQTTIDTLKLDEIYLGGQRIWSSQ